MAKPTRMDEALNHQNRLIWPLEGCTAACQIKTHSLAIKGSDLWPGAAAINIFILFSEVNRQLLIIKGKLHRSQMDKACLININ